MRFVLILFFFTAACATSQPETWESPGVGKIVCLQYDQQECGLRLEKCGPPNYSVEFSCLREATYFGPGDKTAPTPAAAKKEHPPGSPTVPADFAPQALEDLQ